MPGITSYAGAEGQPETSLVLPQQATSDAQLLELWLYRRPARTLTEYRREAACFLDHAGKPLRSVTLGDAVAYVRTREGLAPSTQGRTINVLKSLFAFAHRIGYVPFNVAAPLRCPYVKDQLAERILPEGDVYGMLHSIKDHPRDYLLLLLAYATGGRVSELMGLSWRDVQPRDEGGQVVLFGKRGKTRSVLLPAAPWRKLLELGRAGPDDPVFVSRFGNRLSSVQAWRVVRAAARRAGIIADVSPHWLRHAHASHALDRGAPISLVQATLGHSSVGTTGKYLHARPNDSSGRYLGLKDL